MNMKNKEKILLDITNDKCPITFVKTKIASKGFLSSEKENGLYEIKNKLETLRISELDNRLFKSVIKLK